MGKLVDLVKKIMEDPEQGVASLPELLVLAEEMEQNDIEQLDRITKLQESNRALLQQIPIPDNEPSIEIEVEPEPPTIEDAVKEILEELRKDKEED
ncbi:MAG: hypothetical protein GX160_03140 [Clostridiales bacterium]|nr:hypothetical protein [Clostridiales bacterium]